MSSETIIRPSARFLAKAALSACFLVALAPILYATMPPIMDFPNHLARIWLIAGGVNAAPLDQIYQIDLAKAGANVGVDLAAAALARLLPIFTLSKILVALMFLGPPLGGALLNRALAGRVHALQLALLALAWSTTAIAGFVNFQISLGLALAFAALVANRLCAREGFALHLLFSTILTFVHPFGVAMYAGCVAALRLGPVWRGMLERPGRLARDLVLIIVVVATPMALAMVLLDSQARPPWPFWGDAGNIVDPVHILTIWLSPILSYNLAADLATTAPIVALVAFALATGLARPHAGLTLAAGALFALAPLAPDAIGDGSWLPQRLPIMAALLLLSGLRPGAEPRWLPATLGVLVLTRALWIGSIWIGRQSDIAGLFETFGAMTPGASVITLKQEPRDWAEAPTGRFMIGSPNGMRATGRHLGALAVIERHAFVPTLFSVPGQHPLDVLPPWREEAVDASSIPYPRQLGTDVSGDPYLKHWREHFDYVLVLNADLPTASGFSPAVAGALTLVADTGFARLYKVAGAALTREDAPAD